MNVLDYYIRGKAYLEKEDYDHAFEDFYTICETIQPDLLKDIPRYGLDYDSKKKVAQALYKLIKPFAEP